MTVAPHDLHGARCPNALCLCRRLLTGHDTALPRGAPMRADGARDTLSRGDSLIAQQT